MQRGDMSSSMTTLVELSGLPKRRFPRDRLFDLAADSSADTVRNQGMIDIILVLCRLCDVVTPASRMSALLSHFFEVRCYLCVKPRSRTNTVRYGVEYRYPSVRHIQPRMDDGTWLRKPPPVGRFS